MLIIPASADAQPINKTSWSLKYVDSLEIALEDGRGINAFDGNPGTIWNAKYSNPPDPLPHEIQINLVASYNITGFTYLPRKDASN